MLGILLTTVIGSEVAYWLFFVTAVAFPIAGRVWRPAYRVMRAILGNPNLPQEPMPRVKRWSEQQKVPSAVYPFVIWFLALDVVVFYLAIRYFLK